MSLLEVIEGVFQGFKPVIYLFEVLQDAGLALPSTKARKISILTLRGSQFAHDQSYLVIFLLNVLKHAIELTDLVKRLFKAH